MLAAENGSIFRTISRHNRLIREAHELFSNVIKQLAQATKTIVFVTQLSDTFKIVLIEFIAFI